jgi:hypothetical protein
MVKKYRAQGWQSEFATPCLREGSKKPINKPYETWNLNEGPESLDGDVLQKIYASYNSENTDNLGDTKNATLLIRNSELFVCSRTPGPSWQRFYNEFYTGVNREPYKLLWFTDNIALDYFTTSKYVFIKTHPNHPIGVEDLPKRYGPDARPVVNMPFQFLSRLFEKNGVKFDTILGYASSSLTGLSPSVYSRSVILGVQFFKLLLLQIHDIYAALRFALDKLPDCEIFCPAHMQDSANCLLTALGSEKRCKAKTNDKFGHLRNAFCILNEDFYSDVCYNGVPSVHSSVTLCFLNVREEYYFYDKARADNYSVIEVKKAPLRATLDPCRTTSIWLYNTSPDFRGLISDFAFVRELPRTGIALSAKQMSDSDRKSAEQSRICKEFDVLKTRYDTLYNAILEIESVRPLLLRHETDLVRYLSILLKHKSEALIVVAVKTTPGDCVPNAAKDLLARLGFAGFVKQQWTSYIGVSDKGRVLYDVSTPDEQPTEYRGEAGGMKISAVSQAQRRGDTKARIVINGVDYAVNKRGLNIVVWAGNENEPTDSVAFDAHKSPEAQCFRK